jgi:cytoskeleton protein RodZ
MTGTPDTSYEETPLSGSKGPGRLVREARERARLSTEDLAAQIKLARNTLDAIERDDFAQLNEPVYVRGYYRKLSKVLPV